MDEITIGGVTYLPATNLAKQYRYTTDYIGQLCRSKKIDAQLVGRSWYVNPLSLQNHKNAKYTKPNNIKAKSITNNEEEVKIRVEPVLKKATVKSLRMSHASDSLARNFSKRIDWKPLKYEVDDSDLLPPLKREIGPVALKINLADSSDITIKSIVKSTTLVPEDLPEVSLKGSVKVESLNEYFDIKTEPKAIFNGLVDINEETLINTANTPSIKAPEQPKKTERTDFAHRVSRISAVSTVLIEEDETEIRKFSTLTITAGLALGLLLVFASFTLEHKATATASSYVASVGFSVDEYQNISDAF